MAFDSNTKEEIYRYCYGHLPDNAWYEKEFDFIQDEALHQRLVEEFKGIRFAYKLYEGIEADAENLVFEVRHQILAYATIYEAVIHYVLYTFYADTDEFHKMTYQVVPVQFSIANLDLSFHGDKVILSRKMEQKKDDSKIRFEDKCRTAEKLGLLHISHGKDGEQVDIVREIIEIYRYRNAIHLVAELRKGISYELDLSKKAYRRMRPFIDQIKEKLRQDGKYSNIS